MDGNLIFGQQGFEELQYRYNVYRNQLYFKMKEIDYEISTPDSIDLLILDGKKFVYQNTDQLKQGKKRFTEVVVDGKAMLFINYYHINNANNTI